MRRTVKENILLYEKAVADEILWHLDNPDWMTQWLKLMDGLERHSRCVREIEQELSWKRPMVDDELCSVKTSHLSDEELETIVSDCRSHVHQRDWFIRRQRLEQELLYHAKELELAKLRVESHQAKRTYAEE